MCFYLSSFCNLGYRQIYFYYCNNIVHIILDPTFLLDTKLYHFTYLYNVPCYNFYSFIFFLKSFITVWTFWQKSK